MTHRVAISSSIQKTGFQFLTRWYRVPTTLHKLSQQCDSICWRYQGEEGTLLHIFWSCPIVQNCWTQVKWRIYRLTDVQMLDYLAGFLLHLSLLSTKTFTQCCKIMHSALQNTAPMLNLLFAKISKVHLMEQLMEQLMAMVKRCWQPQPKPLNQLLGSRVHAKFRNHVAPCSFSPLSSLVLPISSPSLPYHSFSEHIQYSSAVLFLSLDFLNSNNWSCCQWM